MTHKRRSPLRGPMLTVALMLVSVGVVVAIGDRTDARLNNQEPAVAATPSHASAGQDAGR